MLRNDWTFEYTASKLAEGARKQLAHREERVEWWSKKKAEIMDEVRLTGLEVNESIAALNYTQSLGAGRAPQISVKQDLQQKLAECQAKIHEHSKALKDYKGWIQVLDANPENRLKLTQDDWLYFFGS